MEQRPDETKKAYVDKLYEAADVALERIQIDVKDLDEQVIDMRVALYYPNWKEECYGSTH